jgi:hypothetical protein
MEDNARLRIKGAGQIQIQTNRRVINLLNILYIFNLSVNLLSSAVLYNINL